MKHSAAEILREYGPFPGVDHVHGVTYDGQHVWFAAGDKLNALDPTSGTMLRSIEVAAHAGTAFDGRHLFQIAEDRIQKIDLKTGRVLATIPAPGGGGNSGLAWAEGTLWVAQYRDRKIHQIDPEFRGDPADHRDQPLRHRGHLDRRRALARHLGRRRERSDPHRSTYRRSPGADRDAARRERIGAGVRRRRSVLLRRWKQRDGAGRPPAEARLSGEQRNVGWVEFFTRPNNPSGVLGLASARPNLPATSAMRLHPVRVSIRPSARTIRTFLKSVGMDSWG